jgi:hypothetical protein
MDGPASRRTRRVRPAPRVSCRTPAVHALCLALPLIPRATRRLCLALRFRAPQQLASIGRQQVDEHIVTTECFSSDLCCIYLDVELCYNGHTRMLQSVCFKCSSCFKCILKVFYLDVAYVAMAIRMLQVYVSNVLSILDVCCKYFIWIFHMFQ